MQGCGTLLALKILLILRIGSLHLTVRRFILLYLQGFKKANPRTITTYLELFNGIKIL